MQNTDIKALAEQLEQSNLKGIQLDDNAIVQYRNNLLALLKQGRIALSQTSLKDHTYDDESVIDYIDDILQRGLSLQQTKLSHNTMFVDAQHLPRFKAFIVACVQNSGFSRKAFTTAGLQYQRNAIEQSSTLHQLRQNVKAMIGPLAMYRESLLEPATTEYSLPSYDAIVEENEALRARLKEAERVVNEITSLYDNALKEHKSKLETIQLIDAFKQEHNCTDAEACKVLKVSRTSLNRWRTFYECPLGSTGIVEDEANRALLVA